MEALEVDIADRQRESFRGLTINTIIERMRNDGTWRPCRTFRLKPGSTSSFDAATRPFSQTLAQWNLRLDDRCWTRLFAISEILDKAVASDATQTMPKSCMTPIEAVATS